MFVRRFSKNKDMFARQKYETVIVLTLKGNNRKFFEINIGNGLIAALA